MSPRRVSDVDTARRDERRSSTVCGDCGAPNRNGLQLCASCLKQTAESLARLWVRDAGTRAAGGTVGVSPCLLDELEITATRQARLSDAALTVRGTRTRSLPYDPRAAEVLAEDVALLIDAARHFGAPELVIRLRDARAAAAWLGARLHTIASHPDLAILASELHWRVERATRIVDRPPTTWYAGHCGQCRADLYAEEGASVIRCRTCGATHDVWQQRARLLEGVEDRLATASEISRAVHLLERPVSVSMIDNWHARGQLLRRGHSTAGHFLYRIGDVLDLAAASAMHHNSGKSAKPETRRARRAGRGN